MEEMGMPEFGTGEAEQKVKLRPTYSQEQEMREAVSEDIYMWALKSLLRCLNLSILYK
jgi:hypothetical protein